MTKDEITQAVKEVIAQNSRYTIDEIKVSDPIDKFITSFMKAKLAGQIKRRFDKAKTTELTNNLYETIKKVSQLIDYVDKLYNPTL